MNKNTENKGAFIGIQFLLAEEKFSGQIMVKNGVTQVGGRWVRNNNPLGLKTLLDCWKVTLKGLEKFDFALTEIDLLYENTSSFLLYVNSENYGKIKICVTKSEDKFIVAEIPQKIMFQDIPAVGKYFSDKDHISLNQFELILDENGIKDVGFEILINGIIISIGENDHQNTNHGLKRYEVSETNTDAFHWVEIKKKFGPVSIVRLGVAYINGVIYISGDIDISIACLTFYLVGLYIGIPFGTSDSGLNFGIMGLGINISTGTFMISGELIKEIDKESYSGRLAIQCGGIGITVLAAYESTSSYESFFAFGALHAVLGGPPAFVITGLSAGFGINYNLNIPDAKDIKKLPLVQAAIGADSKWDNISPNDALREMKDYIYSDNGETMLAAGITFTTFGLLTTCAIATFTFGNSTQAALLGLSIFDMPQLVQNPFIHVALGIRVIYNFNDGILKIDGAISDDSYLFDKNCKLRGGFAWYMWFKGEHYGDFVFSIGGYHKNFAAPVHYPSLDRVGINWSITKGLSLTGKAYFALTPSCIMAGGSLALTYTWKNLSAWIRLSADMIISWFPFFYDIYVNASIGASYTLHFFGKHTYSIELSASLHMWGPDFSISIYVKWYIISFTVEYVQNKQRGNQPASWNEVSQQFFAKDSTNQLVSQSVSKNKISSKYFSLNSSNEAQSEGVWAFSSSGFAVDFKSKIPLTQISFHNNNKKFQNNIEIGILPMGNNTVLESCVEIHILSDGMELNQEEYENILVSEIREGLPYAIWGTKKITKPDSSIIFGVLTGVSITLRNRSLESHSTNLYDVSKLCEIIDVSAKPSADIFHDTEVSKTYEKDINYEFMKECLKNEEILTKREKILEDLKVSGYDIWDESEINTIETEQDPGEYLGTYISYQETGKEAG